MHASIRRYIVGSGSEKEAIDHAINGVIPLLEREAGFVSYYFIDTGDGEMIGISLYETTEGAQKANTVAATYVSEHMLDHLKRSAVLEGEVVAHATAREKSLKR